MAASAGAGISSSVILILGIANLIADGFSMGSSAYLAASAEHEESIRDSQKRSSPKIIGAVTFLAFVVVGSVPVLPYLIDVIANLKAPNAVLFYVSSALTAATFLAIGFIKGKVSQTITLAVCRHHATSWSNCGRASLLRGRHFGGVAGD